MKKDYYRILGVDPKAPVDELKKAYHKLAFVYHPDKNSGDKEAEEHFKVISEAYEILRDERRRKHYDLTYSDAFFPIYAHFHPEEIEHYFIVRLSEMRVKLNEEFTVTFSYSGEGRLFRKPSFKNFFMAGNPFVSFRQVLIDGVKVKETSLKYVLAPLTTGDIIIEPASIKINHETFFTDQISVQVSENKCHYTEGRIADGTPLEYALHFETPSGTRQNRWLHRQDHILLVPRSHYAEVYHRIGFWMKIIYSIWGAATAAYFGFNIFLGFLAGSLFGSACCYGMYAIAGVRSKFFSTDSNEMVQEYFDRGYRRGRSTGSSLLNGQVLHWIGGVVS